MYLEHGKKYRLHRCERYVYTKPVLRKADTRTHKHTAKCAVSSSKQSGTERKQETPVLYVCAHIVYSKLTFVGISTLIVKSNTQSKKGYVNGEKYAVLKQGSRDITCVMEGTELSGGRLKRQSQEITEFFQCVAKWKPHQRKVRRWTWTEPPPKDRTVRSSI